MYWLYFALWMLVGIVKPIRKDQKGIVWTALGKLPPFRNISREAPLGRAMRFLILWTILFVVTSIIFSAMGMGYEQQAIIRVILFILIELDDFVNGDDDDKKRRWEAVKNKIKWLWTPQMEPAGVKVGS